MKKNGFTLIELLAVITILSIILLIVVPAVSNIINNSKGKTKEQSVELYGRALENAISAYYVKYPTKNTVTLKELMDENLIEYKGSEVECETVRIIGRDVFLSNCKVGNKSVDHVYGENFGKLIEDIDKNNKISVGDKYTYKVNDQDKFNFYVLGENADGTVNLIMDRNICEDGTPTNDTTECYVKWFDTSSTKMGPVTAMTYLYNATKNWMNVPDMIMNYTDEGKELYSGAGYTGITTDVVTKITTIIGNNTSDIATVGTSEYPLKARLMMLNEAETIGCETAETCPAWVTENKKYWLLSSYAISHDGNSYSTDLVIVMNGVIKNNETPISRRVGIRPVITVPKENLMN